MKELRRGVTAGGLAAAMLLATVPAWAQELPGPYLGLGVGANWLQKLEAEGPFGGKSSLDYKVGPIGTGSLGYAFGNGFRGEFEFGYRRSPFKSISPGAAATALGTDLNANSNTYSYMANALYDFHVAPAWLINVGAGIGAANVRINNVGHEWPFAYQAMTGVEYGLTPNVKLGLEYKFLGTDKLRLKTNAVFTDRPNYYDHAVLLTLRYTFGAAPVAAAAAAAALPAAVPPPTSVEPAAGAVPPPPVSRDFNVYFATNSATLSPTARDIVRQAADSAKENAPAHINVAGHTDTVGSAAFNQRLSVRRAEAIRKELVANGVAPDAIETTGYGESDLAVPTADNVNEPRNRRVVIVVHGAGT